MDPGWIQRQCVQQSGPRLGLVAVSVAGREEPLIAPPHVDPAPVDRVAGWALPHRSVDPVGDPAAGEHHRGEAAFRLGVHQPYQQSRRGALGQQVRVGVDPYRSLSHAQPPACAAMVGSCQMCTRAGGRLSSP